MKKFGITVKDLKDALNEFPDNTEIFIENSVNICGNISKLCEVRKDDYGFFGRSIPCIILGSEENTKFEE